MGDKLLSPPLIEALCEFRFTPSSPWDWTLPGRLYDQLAEEFPERSQVDGVGVQIKLGPGKPLSSQVIKGPDRVQMKRSDGSAMVQVGPHLLAVNYLRFYPNWETFRGLILSTFEKNIKLCGECNLQRIGLRYINQIPLPEGKCDLETLISLAPSLKGPLDRPLMGFYQRYEILHDSPKGILIHQTGIPKTDHGNVIMVDLDFGSLELEGICDQFTVANWLNAAHDRIYESFVASLHPDLYEKFRRG
ncbi:MAG: hypothetical protein A2156_14515 [Deltaproteobacteria bacterium RBG_16_48_10]|nr:MAG: hypothetical protein A2156_14515 [Deltaproteobacteria bacterium RBG_16_48_10]